MALALRIYRTLQDYAPAIDAPGYPHQSADLHSPALSAYGILAIIQRLGRRGAETDNGPGLRWPDSRARERPNVQEAGRAMCSQKPSSICRRLCRLQASASGTDMQTPRCADAGARAQETGEAGDVRPAVLLRAPVKRIERHNPSPSSDSRRANDG